MIVPLVQVTLGLPPPLLPHAIVRIGKDARATDSRTLTRFIKGPLGRGKGCGVGIYFVDGP